MTRLTIPFLDVNILDVTITSWLKNPGDSLSQGECVAELTTDKATFELEAPASGTLLAIYAPAKSIVPINYIIGLIGTAGSTDPSIEEDNNTIMQAYQNQTSTSAAPTTSAAPQPVAAPPATAAPATSQTAVRATPRVRRQAHSLGIDLADVQKATGASMITSEILDSYLASLS